MSDLTAFAAHARTMSTAQHTPECVATLARWQQAAAARRYFDVPDPGPRPVCPGCVTDDERALWARLADEAEAYMEPEPGLWGDDDA